MRIGMLFAVLGSFAAIPAQVQAGADGPVTLGPMAMDRITAGVFGGGTAAGAVAESDFIASTHTDGATLIRTKEDPPKGSLRPTSGITGGAAVAVTIGGSDSRGVTVETQLGGGGFELARIQIGGTVNGPIGSLQSETLVVIETIADPARLN